MHLNVIKLRSSVRAGLIVAILFSALVVASLYYFYFVLLRQEATLLTTRQPLLNLRGLSQANAGWIADRVQSKMSLPVVAPETVVDVFDRARVPARE